MGTRLALLIGVFFALACSCNGCLVSTHEATVYAEDGETVLAEASSSSATVAIESACQLCCTDQGEAAEADCVPRCVSGEGPRVEVHKRRRINVWKLIAPIIKAIFRASCTS